MFRETQSSQSMKTRWTGLGAGLLLLVIVTTGLYLGNQTRRQFLDIADGWSEFSSEADRKGALISAIRGYLGYGGIIHTFKNYVLRQDDQYRQLLLKQLAQFDVVTADYLSLPTSEEERAALTTIIATVNAYRSKLSVAEMAAANEWTAEQTDRQVRVDDTAAFSAFDMLEKIWQSNRERQTERLIASVAARAGTHIDRFPVNGAVGGRISGFGVHVLDRDASDAIGRDATVRRIAYPPSP